MSSIIQYLSFYDRFEKAGSQEIPGVTLCTPRQIRQMNLGKG